MYQWYLDGLEDLVLFPHGIIQTLGESSKLNKAIKKITLHTGWLIFEPTFFFSENPFSVSFCLILLLNSAMSVDILQAVPALGCFSWQSSHSTCAVDSSSMASASTQASLTL